MLVGSSDATPNNGMQSTHNSANFKLNFVGDAKR